MPCQKETSECNAEGHGGAAAGLSVSETDLSDISGDEACLVAQW